MRRIRCSWSSRLPDSPRATFLRYGIVIYSRPYKARGAGSLIMQRGYYLADKDGLNYYIDASPQVKQVYKKF
jgi:hypothetical protein